MTDFARLSAGGLNYYKRRFGLRRVRSYGVLRRAAMSDVELKDGSKVYCARLFFVIKAHVAYSKYIGRFIAVKIFSSEEDREKFMQSIIQPTSGTNVKKIAIKEA